MNASTVVVRLPTRARQSSKRGIPTATPHEINTRKIKIAVRISWRITL